MFRTSPSGVIGNSFGRALPDSRAMQITSRGLYGVVLGQFSCKCHDSEPTPSGIRHPYFISFSRITTWNTPYLQHKRLDQKLGLTKNQYIQTTGIRNTTTELVIDAVAASVTSLSILTSSRFALLIEYSRYLITTNLARSIPTFYSSPWILD